MNNMQPYSSMKSLASNYWMGLDMSDMPQGPLLQNGNSAEDFHKVFDKMEPKLKNKVRQISTMYCKGGAASNLSQDNFVVDVYTKLCCEMFDFCSFYYQTWFYLLATGLGILLLNLITIVFICLVCRKKGGRMSGGLDEKVENVGEEKEEDVE